MSTSILIVNLATPLVYLATAAVGDLPSEATLPGAKPTPQVRSLPPESQLPGKPAAPKQPPTGLPREAEPVRPSPSDQPPRVETAVLPNEAQLPAGFVVDSKPLLAADLVTLLGADAEGTGDVAAGESPSDAAQKPNGGGAAPGAIAELAGRTPWLRLNMHGQVGVLRALRYSVDGTRLFAGGDDKTVEVWSRPAADGAKRGAATRWVHERAIRWPVERGPRGRIQALAEASGVIAFAGYGILGGIGEIWLVDPLSGELKRTLRDEENGHRQLVAGLSFAPGRTDLLASHDLAGQVMVWRQDAATGLWRGKTLRTPDHELLGSEDAEKLRFWRRAAPIVMLDAQHVVIPKWLGWKTLPSGIVPEWTLESLDVETAEAQSLADSPIHRGGVFALGVSPDRRHLVSADATGRLAFWNLPAQEPPHVVQQLFAISAIGWLADNETVVVGSARSPRRQNQAAWQQWTVRDGSEPERKREELLAEDVLCLAVHPSKPEVAMGQGAELIVEQLATETPSSERLRGLARPVLRVAFAAQEPLYRVAIGTRVVEGGGIPLEQAFDLGRVELAGERAFEEKDWLNDQAWRGDWKLQAERTATDEIFWLTRGDEKVARLPLSPRLHGRPSATCWIPDSQGRPFALAIGTSLQGNIFVFELKKADVARVLRQFRGHEGGVRSLAASRDRRYLCSGSDDATVRVWNLADFDRDSELVNRWGAEFEVQGDSLLATLVREDSRLHFRGIRAGDRLHSMAWRQEGKTFRADRPAEMLKQLQLGSWDAQLVFDFRRRDLQLDGFQQLPAWQPLAALYVTPGREWALWTPAGYYDASFDGHKLFGWQVNRGVDLAPEFFLAAQFRRGLERPEVMQRLLATGSLPAALRATDAAPGAGQDAVLPQIQLQPKVELLEPRPQQAISDRRTTIRAKVTIGTGLQLRTPKAFANGVVALRQRLLEERDVPGGREFLYEWDASLPADERVMIQVVASSDAEVAHSASVLVRNAAGPSPSRRIFVVAAGVNEYRDAQIQKLDFAAKNAQQVAEEWRRQSSLVEATTLVNEQATRGIWQLVTSDYADRLEQEAGPDDLLVFFLSGHGVRDEETGKYYFIAADARYDDVKAKRFADCLSFDDFAAFARVPCRKLVVLDTCHAGAVQQPLRQQDLKGAIRALQDDVVYTLTASEGTQEAAEDRDQQLGRFTARLLEALRGAADEAARGGDQDGLVTLREARDYVQSAVSADSERTGVPQHPTAGPIDLLDVAPLPLTFGPRS